jgi:hypothetical protein
MGPGRTRIQGDATSSEPDAARFAAADKTGAMSPIGWTGSRTIGAGGGACCRYAAADRHIREPSIGARSRASSASPLVPGADGVLLQSNPKQNKRTTRVAVCKRARRPGRVGCDCVKRIQRLWQRDHCDSRRQGQPPLRLPAAPSNVLQNQVGQHRLASKRILRTFGGPSDRRTAPACPPVARCIVIPPTDMNRLLLA